MKRLSKSQLGRKAEIVELLRTARVEMEDAILSYNRAIRAANEFAAEVTADLDSYFSDRTEKWQDGDAGTAYADWVREWECFNVDELNEVDAVDDDFDALPNELP